MSRKTKVAVAEEVDNISVVGRHVSVTDAMKEYAADKVGKIERFSHHLLDVQVTMDIQRIEHRVDIMARVNNVKIKVQASSDNMYASIDKAVDRLQNKLRRYKDKLHTHVHKEFNDVALPVDIYPSEINEVEVNEAIERETERHTHAIPTIPRLVKRETRPLKTLTVDEAIMKIDLSGDAFMVYRSEEDQGMRVIYRRADHNLGVIQIQ